MVELSISVLAFSQNFKNFIDQLQISLQQSIQHQNDILCNISVCWLFNNSLHAPAVIVYSKHDLWVQSLRFFPTYQLRSRIKICKAYDYVRCWFSAGIRFSLWQALISFLKECLRPNCISLYGISYLSKLVFFATSLFIHSTHFMHLGVMYLKNDDMWPHTYSFSRLGQTNWDRNLQIMRWNHGVASLEFLRDLKCFFLSNLGKTRLHILSNQSIYQQTGALCCSSICQWLSTIQIMHLLWLSFKKYDLTWIHNYTFSLLCESYSSAWVLPKSKFTIHALQSMGQLIGCDLFNFFLRTSYSPFFSSICDQLLCIP